MCSTFPLLSMLNYYCCCLIHKATTSYYMCHIRFHFHLCCVCFFCVLFCLYIWVWWLIDILCLFHFFIYNLVLWNPRDYLSMKEGSLFCFVVMKSNKLRCFKLYFWCLGKISRRRGAWPWFHDVWIGGAIFLIYWMIFSLKTKLNHSCKFQGIRMCLWFFWENLDEQNLMKSIW